MQLRRTLQPVLLTLALAGASAPTASFAQISAGLSITVAPPALPVYAQPAIPAPGYLWTPGYWAWGAAGYYWVPGTWVRPPAIGLLWTPGYWGWGGGAYAWHAGYWGPHVGFYGGVNYGFGYGGVGFEGGYWAHGAFFYNTAVNNVHGPRFANIYTKTVVNDVNVTRVSFNGGAGGTAARPTPQDNAAMHEAHRPPTGPQTQHEHVASANPQLRASVNHGAPAQSFAATRKPGAAPHPGNVHPAAVQHEPQKQPDRAAEAHGRGEDEHHHD
jgi:WXXGXW repeat (2 copies)